MTSPVCATCRQTNHLFARPLCPSQHLIRRIANVFFHIFTFAAPLAVYHVIACCIRIKASIHHANQAKLAIQLVRSHLDEKNDCSARREAFEYACSLMEGQNLSSKKWYGEPILTSEGAEYTYERYASLKAPLSPVIAFLAGYLRGHQKELIPDHRMKLAYVISCLMLEELPEFIKAYPTCTRYGTQEERTCAAALTRQDSYQYKVFFDCPIIYYGLRNDEEVDESIFYKEKTPASNWRALYNDYCDRIYQIVSKEDLERGDQRHVAWTGKDVNGNSFNRCPGSTPS